MDINLYINNSEPERVIKSLTNVATLTGSLHNESDVVNPYVIIEGAYFPSSANYAYIADFGRYYYVTEVSSIRNGYIGVSLASDPLMSFANDIKNLRAIIDRQANSEHANMYLPDDVIVHDSREFYAVKTFQNGFNDNGEFILITAGA